MTPLRSPATHARGAACPSRRAPHTPYQQGQQFVALDRLTGASAGQLHRYLLMILVELPRPRDAKGVGWTVE